ncbi:MAG: LA_3696 family protein [Anaerolineae bacterium]
MPAVVIPRLLRDTFGDDVSESLVDFFNELLANSRQETIVFVEEKFERRLTEEFSRLRAEDLARLDKRITEEISRLRVEDIAGLRRELADMRAELLQEVAESMAQLRQEMAESMAQLRQEMAENNAQLRQEMAGYRADLVRWMFIFWVGQVGAILAILFVFFK